MNLCMNTNVVAPCIKSDTRRAYNNLIILHLKSQSVSAAFTTFTAPQYLSLTKLHPSGTSDSQDTTKLHQRVHNTQQSLAHFCIENSNLSYTLVHKSVANATWCRIRTIHNNFLEYLSIFSSGWLSQYCVRNHSSQPGHSLSHLPTLHRYILVLIFLQHLPPPKFQVSVCLPATPQC